MPDSNSDSSTSQPGASKNGAGKFILVAILLALISGIAWYIFLNNPDNGGGEPQQEMITRKQALAFEQTANRASGFLEIQQQDAGSDESGAPRDGYLEAIKLYEQLQKELPNEPMPIRNLAIARTLNLTQGIPESDLTDEVYQQTVRAIKSFEESEPKSAVPHLLLASIREKGEDFSEAIENSLNDVRTAKRLDPENAATHWSFIQAAELAGDADSLKSEIDESYKKLYEVATDNIEVLKTYPVYLARRQDPRLEKLLADSRDLLTIAGKMQAIEKAQSGREAKNRVAEYADAGIKAVQENDWSKALQSTMAMGNLMNGLAIQKLDYRKLAPHPLDYLSYSFSDSFYGRVESGNEAIESKTDIASLFSDKNATEIPIPFKQFAVVDVNRDTQSDIVGISEQKLVATGRDEQGNWSEILSHDLAGNYHGLFAVDLDRDRKPDEDWAKRMHKLAVDSKRDRILAEEHADPDFVVFGKDGLKIFINDNDKITEQKQNETIDSLKGITAAALVDIEADSDLDLIVAASDGMHILLNAGNLTFTEFSDASVLPDPSLKISAIRIADWNRDADIDVLVLTESDGIGILENLLHGRFRWRKLSGDFDKISGGKTMQIAEVDGNVSWDLVVAQEVATSICLTNTVDATVSAQNSISVSDASLTGIAVGDLNNDTMPDFIGFNSDGLHLIQNVGEFQSPNGYTKSEFGAVSDVASCTPADIDLDGDLDLIVSNGEATKIFENTLDSNNSLIVLPVGIDEGKGRVNHNGIGSLIELKSGGRYQAQIVTSPVMHFGLGEQESADLVRLVWTNGVPQPIVDAKANVVIREVMFEISSCPFVYVWNGQQFEFFSDCLWAAPIGLQLEEGVLAPTRAWEYLKISGDLMKPDGDYYKIQLTEELWEAAYFDQVELIAVDHPADVDIYTNEKVGPPNITEHKIFGVAKKRTPVSATDKRGTNVLAEIASEDGVHMVGFARTERKGLAEEHFLELDLGDFDFNAGEPESVMLFLTGWIRPSDSSLNVHFTQHPELKGASPPQLFVPDDDDTDSGKWKLALAPMGFPGGKTKTIAIDLTKALADDDHRVRIQTSNEIYWDQVFFSVNDKTHEIKTTTLPVESANLHYRGFSRNYFVNEQSPEWFDYQQAETEPRWPPMNGRFTRYGEVRELLTDADDKLVVLSSGDEMTVRFRVPKEELRAGWKRDFILHSVGYDKDANLNTLLGQSSEPLPFLKMSSYPIPTGEVKPDSDEYREYLREYQTRRQSWSRYWKQVQRFENVTQ